MHAQIKQWGNSLALRIPKPVADSLQLQVGSDLELVLSDGALLIKPGRHKKNLADMMARVTPENIHPVVDWGKPRGKELW